MVLILNSPFRGLVAQVPLTEINFGYFKIALRTEFSYINLQECNTLLIKCASFPFGYYCLTEPIAEAITAADM